MADFNIPRSRIQSLLLPQYTWAVLASYRKTCTESPWIRAPFPQQELRHVYGARELEFEAFLAHHLILGGGARSTNTVTSLINSQLAKYSTVVQLLSA